MADPSVIEIDSERALHWLRVGAQPSSQVRTLLDRVGIWDVFVAERPSAAVAPKPGRADRPAKQKLSKKAAAKAAAPPAEPPAIESPPVAEEPAGAVSEGPEEPSADTAEVTAPSADEVPASSPEPEGEPAIEETTEES